MAEQKMRQFSSIYNVTISDDPSDEVWDNFLLTFSDSHYKQTSRWGRAYRVLGWQAVRFKITKGSDLVSGAQVLMRPAPPLGWAGYIPHGIIDRFLEVDGKEDLINAILHICKEFHLIYLAIPVNENGGMAFDVIKSIGLKPTVLGDIDPPCNLRMDLTVSREEIMANMGRNKRNQVKASQKRGLVFHEGSRCDLDIFFELHTKDAQRLGFRPNHAKFFQSLWDIYRERNLIHLFLTEWQGNIINALICLVHGHTLTAYKIGWSKEEALRYPNEAIHFGAMMWAKEHGFRFYDFEGFGRKEMEVYQSKESLPEWFRNSYAYFKIQMGGQLIIDPPLYDFMTNPCMNLAYRRVYPAIKDLKVYRKLLALYRHSTVDT